MAEGEEEEGGEVAAYLSCISLNAWYFVTRALHMKTEGPFGTEKK
jgi:hypothetical protein